MTRKSHQQTEALPFFSAIDKITIAFCAWILVYMLAGLALGRTVIEPWLHLPAYLSILTLVLLMAWAQQRFPRDRYPRFGRALSFVRAIYPVLFFTYFYISGYAVNRIIFGE